MINHLGQDAIVSFSFRVKVKIVGLMGVLGNLLGRTHDIAMGVLHTH